MNFPIRLVPEARAEFDESADWYERQKPGLGADYIAEVRIVFNRIAANPRAHGMVHGEIRKAVVHRFPYIVLYFEDVDEVVVIAVFHTSRDPAIWKARI